MSAGSPVSSFLPSHESKMLENIQQLSDAELKAILSPHQGRIIRILTQENASSLPARAAAERSFLSSPSASEGSSQNAPITCFYHSFDEENPSGPEADIFSRALSPSGFDLSFGFSESINRTQNAQAQREAPKDPQREDDLESVDLNENRDLQSGNARGNANLMLLDRERRRSCC